MAILTKEQLMESIKNRVGEDTSDEALAFIENVNDTIENLSSDKNTDWKAKYEENDAAWRQKYKDRFFYSSSEDEDDDFEEEEKKKPMTYEALFEEE